MGLYELDFGTKVSRYPLKRDEDSVTYEEKKKLFQSFRKQDVGTEKEEACLSYLKRYPDLIKVAGYESPAMIDVLIEENPYHIGYLDYPTEAVCLKAIRMNPDKFSDVFYEDPLQLIEKHLTPRICWEAIRQNPQRVEFIPSHLLTDRIILEVLKGYPSYLIKLEIIYPNRLKQLVKSEVDEWVLTSFLGQSVMEMDSIELDEEFKLMAYWVDESCYRKLLRKKWGSFRFPATSHQLRYEFQSNEQGEREARNVVTQKIFSIPELIIEEPVALLWLTNDELSYRLARYSVAYRQQRGEGIHPYSLYHLLEVL